MPAIELTLAIIKPHIIKNPVVLRTIQKLILTSNFQIVKSKRHKFTDTEVSQFYGEHCNKFFYNRLITFMQSGPSDLYILAKARAISDWRQLLGPTKVFRAQFEAPNTIRGRFGQSDTRNVAHGSDSAASARKEIAIVFPEFNIDAWFRKNQTKIISENSDLLLLDTQLNK